MSDTPNPAPSGWARQKTSGRVTIVLLIRGAIALIQLIRERRKNK